MVPLRVDSFPTKHTIPSISSGTTMSSNNQKIFDRFIHMDPPKFSGAIGKDAYEFMIYC